MSVSDPVPFVLVVVSVAAADGTGDTLGDTVLAGVAVAALPGAALGGVVLVGVAVAVGGGGSTSSGLV